jgi:hypothetical protein
MCAGILCGKSDGKNGGGMLRRRMMTKRYFGIEVVSIVVVEIGGRRVVGCITLAIAYVWNQRSTY